MVGKTGSGSTAFQNVRHHGCFPSEGRLLKLLETRSNLAPTKKSCDLSFRVSVRSTAKKKGWSSFLKRARESLCNRRGNSAGTCLCITALLDSSTKSHLISARTSTPTVLLSVKQENPYPESPLMFCSPRLVLRLKSLQSTASTFGHEENSHHRASMKKKSCFKSALQQSLMLETRCQQDGVERGKEGNVCNVQVNHFGPDQGSILLSNLPQCCLWRGMQRKVRVGQASIGFLPHFPLFQWFSSHKRS